MPRTIFGSDPTVLEGNYTALATLAHITRLDGQEFFITTHDKDIDFLGNTYVAANAFTNTDFQNRTGTKVDNVEVTAIFDTDLVSEEEIARGLFNFAACTVYEVYWPDPTLAYVILEQGRLGRIMRMPNGVFKTDVRSKFEKLQGKLGRAMSPVCAWSLGDAKCGFPIDPPEVQRSTAYEVGDFVKFAHNGNTDYTQYQQRIYECTVAGTTAGSAPSYTTTVNATTLDGDATFTCRDAWTIPATVSSVSDKQNFNVTFTDPKAATAWFAGGRLFWFTGNNAGTAADVLQWTGAGSVKLAIPTPLTVQVGDTMRLSPGCNLGRRQDCTQKFVIPGSTNFADGNAKRFGGFDNIPGRQYLLQNVARTTR